MNTENQMAIERLATSEIWLPIAGYEGLYEVSDLGRVRSLVQRNNRWKPGVLKPSKIRTGYLQVILCKDGKRKEKLVHRLVADAFIPNPNNLDTVNHKDEDKSNNAASNLEWMSFRDNHDYGTRNKRVAEALINHPKMSKQVQMFDKRGNLLATFPSTMEAKRVTGIANNSICTCCLGKRGSAGGYIWRYT